MINAIHDVPWYCQTPIVNICGKRQINFRKTDYIRNNVDIYAVNKDILK